MGVGPDDADILAEGCDYVFARASQYEAGFNPSEFTALRDAGIAYVPDYVLNAGGMMGASQVIYSEPSRD